MPLPVSVDAAKRQAFGAMFNHSSKDKALADTILNGQLDLSPHPRWDLPETVDWRSDPFQDRNWRAQLHMLRWLDPLRRRAEKGDHRAADAWLRYAESWVTSNPPTGRRVFGAWMDMVDGIRALELCLAVPFTSDFRPSALGWLSDAISVHAEWLSDEKNLGHSNHALHQHQGLFVCGAVLGDTGMTDLAERRLVALFSAAYDEQGINAEGALAYHLANYSWWRIARRRLEAEGRDIPPAMTVLDEVPIELAHATKPDGYLAGIGDTDGLTARAVKHPVTDWVTSSGASGEPPEDLWRLYDAGYFFARSGWGDQERDFAEETFWSASFGAADRVHGHPDGSSLTFSSMGHEWISDPGKFQYGKSAMREYCMSRAAHSLVDLRGVPYDPASVVRCVRREIDETTYDLTFRDEGYEGAILTRRVIYSASGEYLVVIDTVTAETEVEAVQNWQTGPETAVETTRQGFRLTAGKRGELRAAVLFNGTRPEMSTAVGHEDPVAGWVATGWKKREPAPALRFAKTGQRFRFITLIAAGFRGADPTMELVRNAPEGELRLRIETGRVAEQVVISPDSATVIGFSEGADTAAAERSDSGAPELAPLDARTRKRILTETRRARRAAWDDPTRDNREALAAKLQGLRESFSVKDGADLGLRPAINDLREVSHATLSRLEVQKYRPGLINWTRSKDFQPTSSKHPTISVYGTVGPLPRIATDTMVTYNLGSLVLPALVSPAPGDTLTVMFQTAIDRARVHLPIFQRVRFQKELGAGPVVAFADPTLDMSRELRLGWYLGNEELDLHRSIANAVRVLAEQLGVRNIVLQGGSGGGFAALQVGSRIPGSHVVAANPQTDLRRYSIRAYRNAMVAAFGLDGTSVPSDLEPRVSVMKQLAETEPTMAITLVMNSGDTFHQDYHAAPLRELVRSMAGLTFREVTYDLGPGHKSLDNEKYAAVMRGVYKTMSSPAQ